MCSMYLVVVLCKLRAILILAILLGGIVHISAIELFKELLILFLTRIYFVCDPILNFAKSPDPKSVRETLE